MSEKIKTDSFADKLMRKSCKNKTVAKLVAQAEYCMLPFSHGLQNKVDSAIETFVPAKVKKNKKRIRRIKKDMLFSRMHYEINFNQYFLFEFEKKSHIGRMEYVGSHEKARYTDLRAVNQVFRNKFLAYQIFGEYYKRDLVELKDRSDKDAFLEFAKKHPRFILKIEDEALGNGISIVDLNKSGESAEEAFEKILSDGKVHLAEELIVQAQEIAALHPTSVNTVRFTTYLKKDRVMHMFSFLRMGSGGGVIDNATSGGISAAIDLKTGIITTPGYREDMKSFLKHPDTGVKIIGMQIPRWNELLALVDKLATVVPQQKYVGWDLALTNDGWVMVEGNDSAMMTAIQMCERKGIRSVFETAFKK